MAQCLTNKGYITAESERAGAMTTAALAKQAAAVLAFSLNASQQISNYKDQRKIARRSLAMAEDRKNFLMDVYEPRETDLSTEFMTLPALSKDVESLDDYRTRYIGRTRIALINQYDVLIEKIRSSRGRFSGSNFSAALEDAHIEKLKGLIAADTTATIKGYQEWQARQDVNYGRYLQSVAVIKNLQPDSTLLMRNAQYAISNVTAHTQANMDYSLTNGINQLGQYQNVNRMMKNLREGLPNNNELIDTNRNIEGIMVDSKMPDSINLGTRSSYADMTKQPPAATATNLNINPSSKTPAANWDGNEFDKSGTRADGNFWAE